MVFGVRARAVAPGAYFALVVREGDGASLIQVAQRDAEGHHGVRAAGRALRLLASAAAEKHLERVHRRATRAGTLVLQSLLAKSVVLAPLVRVRKHLVRCKRGRA